MKKKKITPAHAAFRFVFIATFSVLSLAATLKYGNDASGVDKTWAVCLFVSIAVGVINSALGLYTLSNKERMAGGDEYTAKIINKASRITLITIVILIAIMFLLLQGFMIANVGKDVTLKNLLDIRIVLCVAAGILLGSSFIFSLLIFIFSKKGISNEL